MLLGKLIQQLGEENSDWEKLAGETYQISGFGLGKNIQFLVQSFPPVEDSTQVARGQVQTLMAGAASFAACVLHFCQELEEFWAYQVWGW